MTAATYQGFRVTGPLSFVEVVENTLGWDPGTPAQRQRIRYAGVLKKKIAENPKLYTWENLLLALEWCRRKQIRVKTPVGVTFYVEPALKKAAVQVQAVPDIETAIERELAQQKPDWQMWVRRLDRARGAARQEVLREWQASRAAA